MLQTSLNVGDAFDDDDDGDCYVVVVVEKVVAEVVAVVVGLVVLVTTHSVPFVTACFQRAVNELIFIFNGALA
jgi:hypothetical protein